jgi:hypothetical protein
MYRLDQTASNTAFSGKVDTGFPSENATMDAPTAIKRRPDAVPFTMLRGWTGRDRTGMNAAPRTGCAERR